MSAACPIPGRVLFLPEINVLAVGDSALYSATPIRRRAEVAIFAAHEGVIVFTAGDLRTVKARTDLEGLCRWDGQHCVAKLGFELVEYRLAKPGGNVANDASDDSPDRVLGILGSNDALRGHNYPERIRLESRTAHLGHTFRCLDMGTTSGESVHLLPRHGGEQCAELRRERIIDLVIVLVLAFGGGGRHVGRRQANLSDRRDECDNLDTVSFFEVLLGDSPSGDAT